ncbi:MAG: hypothetical protein ACLPUO_08615 [Streptosporangiaceae bacterium]
MMILPMAGLCEASRSTGTPRGPGYQADIAALRRSYPAVEWSSFTSWAHRTFGPDGFLGQDTSS